eukprot:9423226-Pyramimonas_sp.AAC.1
MNGEDVSGETPGPPYQHVWGCDMEGLFIREGGGEGREDHLQSVEGEWEPDQRREHPAQLNGRTHRRSSAGRGKRSPNLW